jgi:hypothetical protein
MPTSSSNEAFSSIVNKDVPVDLDLNLSCVSITELDNMVVEHLEETSEDQDSSEKFDDMEIPESFLDDRLDYISEILTADEPGVSFVNSAPNLNIVPESHGAAHTVASSPAMPESNSVTFHIEFHCCGSHVCNNNRASITGSTNLQQIKTVMSGIRTRVLLPFFYQLKISVQKPDN